MASGGGGNCTSLVESGPAGAFARATVSPAAGSFDRAAELFDLALAFAERFLDLGARAASICVAGGRGAVLVGLAGC